LWEIKQAVEATLAEGKENRSRRRCRAAARRRTGETIGANLERLTVRVRLKKREGKRKDCFGRRRKRQER